DGKNRLSPFVNLKSIAIGMSFVRRMALFRNQPPGLFVQFRKKTIAGQCCMHPGKVDAVDYGKCFFIYFGPSYHEYFRFACTVVECRCKRVNHLGTFGSIRRLPCDNNVSPVGERFADRFIRFPAHDDGMARSGTLEKAQVIGQVPKQLVVLADGVIFCGSYNGRYKWTIHSVQDYSADLYGYRRFDTRIRIIIRQFEIFIPKSEQVSNRRIYRHRRQWPRCTAQLEFHLLEMIGVEVCVAKRVYKISG